MTTTIPHRLTIEGFPEEDHGEATVYVNGKQLRPTRSLRLRNHSPTGFSWGYEGSGPAQLALAILLEAGLSDQHAIERYQQFKTAYVRHWPEASYFKTEIALGDWLGLTLPNVEQ